MSDSKKRNIITGAEFIAGYSDGVKDTLAFIRQWIADLGEDEEFRAARNVLGLIANAPELERVANITLPRPKIQEGEPGGKILRFPPMEPPATIQ